VRGKRPLNILQTIGNGCAFLDYDNDNHLDVLLVGSPLALYRGDGRGHFADVTQAVGFDKLSGHFLGCCVGDYDNDGFEDVYLSAYRGGLLLNNKSGKIFKDVTRAVGVAPQPWGTSCAFGDVDNDGRLDLYIGNYIAFGPKTNPQLCDFLGIKSACGPRFYPPQRGALYRNQGGKFRDVTKAWGADKVSGKALGVAFLDFDGSGRQSLAIANDEMPGDLLRNLGGKFKNIGASSGTALGSNGSAQAGMGIDWGDYDNDRRVDLIVTTFVNQAKPIYRNEGDGLFSDNSTPLGLTQSTLPYIAFGVKWFDYDNDGWLDLLIANGHVQDNIADIDIGRLYRQPTQLFRNVNGQRFEDMSAQAGEDLPRRIVGRGLAVGDYDNDGRVDALVVDSEGEPLLLRNETLNVGNWLQIKLRGKKGKQEEGRGSNRDGIGAIVTVEANGRKLIRHCATDGSYLSASDRRVHVGLGKATSATIAVRWTSGATDVYKNVVANRVVVLREGATQAR
jgi:hypothetical protein